MKQKGASTKITQLHGKAGIIFYEHTVKINKPYQGM